MHDVPDPAAPVAGEDEVLDDGARPTGRRLHAPSRPRLPGHWRAAAYVVAAAAIVFAAVHQVSSTDSAPHAVAPATQPASDHAERSDAGLTAALPDPLDSVRALADRPANPTDLVRQDAPAGQCAVVRPGQDPIGSVVREAAGVLGPVVLIDAQRTLDGSTGLCSLTLRARLRRATLTVDIASPPSDHGTTAQVTATGFSARGNDSVEYASAHTVRGWDVLVGAVGSPAALPARRLLSALAVSRALTW